MRKNARVATNLANRLQHVFSLVVDKLCSLQCLFQVVGTSLEQAVNKLLTICSRLVGTIKLFTTGLYQSC